MIIQEKIPLGKYTTFRTGGNARYFAIVRSAEDVRETLVFAHEHGLPVFVLGGGSNVVVDDTGYNGLVMKMEIEGITYEQEKNGTVFVMAGAGVNWDAFVADTIDHGLSGLENLSLIPGTVGAAPVQNIGAYGAEVKDTVDWVEAVDQDTRKIFHFTKEQCEFAYRMSYFKKTPGRQFIITRVGFTLSTTPLLNTLYKDIATYIDKYNVTDITTQKIRDMVIAIRTLKLPNVRDYGTAGSFFKNPIISHEHAHKLLQKYPSLPHFPQSNGWVKVSAAWILDNVCGFKGYQEGRVGVYKNQALVLVNYGGATATEVKHLAQKMINAVQEKTGITLEREVEYI
jgi:UDP-N-acetylmuramate dehydrogenase